MSTDIKLSKAKMSKIVQSGGFFGSWLVYLDKKALRNIARNNLHGFSNLVSNAINRFEGEKEKELSEQERDLLYIFLMKIWIILNHKIIKKIQVHKFMELLKQ